MNEQIALRRAIIDEPDNDAPRLVYADWLDENGQAERAEFIRHQVYNPKETKSANAESFSRLYVYNFSVNEFGPIAYFGFVFRRGFVETVLGTLDSWLEYGPKLMEDHPITRVRIRNKWPFVSIDEKDNKIAYWIVAVGQCGVSSLPNSIFCLVSSDRRVLSRSVNTVEFASKRDAIDALNDAALQWAKEQVR